MTNPHHTIEIGAESGPVASAALLGFNLEMVFGTTGAMLSDRLDNPKFCGPADAQTGIAPGWTSYGIHMSVQCKLIAGLGLTGGECQMIHNYTGALSGGIVQKGITVKAGEELELELWAMVRHQPATLSIMLRPAAAREPDYGKAELTIDTAYWKRYTATFRAPADDRDAVLMILLPKAGTVMIDQAHLRPVGEPHLSAETLERIRSLQLSTLRFPGGCASTNYRWKFGTGPAYLRPSLPDPVGKARADYDFGTDDYLAMCGEMGIQPFLTVNIGSGTPEEAGELAAYCAEWYGSRGREAPVVYFHMGNEHYGAWEISHMTAPMYVQALREYVPRVRANYPKARIVALGEPLSMGIAGQPGTPLRETLLAEASGLFDVLSLNRYKGQWYDNPHEQMLNVVQSVGKVMDDLSAMIADCRKSGSAATVALTEWNYWMRATTWDGSFYEPDDAQHALFYAGMIHAMARQAPDVEAATFYHLLNPMGIVRNERGHVYETSQAALYRLYRPAFPGAVVPVRVVAGELADGYPQLDALALRTPDSLWLFVGNRSHERPAEVALEGALLAGLRLDSATVLAAHYQAPLREAEPDAACGRLRLPPLAIARLRYRVPAPGDGAGERTGP
ncbi:MAG: carbohydrate binding domain-containing protein [Paenibacillaceae bacterium]|nr:carbohydrate binding domain-containing protein [Paenibacillaceae bacterium]